MPRKYRKPPKKKKNHQAKIRILALSVAVLAVFDFMIWHDVLADESPRRTAQGSLAPSVRVKVSATDSAPGQVISAPIDPVSEDGAHLGAVRSGSDFGPGEADVIAPVTDANAAPPTLAPVADASAAQTTLAPAPATTQTTPPSPPPPVSAPEVEPVPSPDVPVTHETAVSVPVRIRIPRIAVDAVIKRMALATDGSMEVPKRPADTGWYGLGPRPGEQGSAVIAGHVSWLYGATAVFTDLRRLTPGDTITVLDDKGGVTTFVVRESRIYAAAADATEIFSSSDGKSRLNLVTCDGEWDKSVKQYTERLVVFADRVME